MSIRTPRIKVCGITQFDDAVAALLGGAEAVGFVHAEISPRHLSIAAISEFVEQLGPLARQRETVVVLVGQTPDQAQRIAQLTGVSWVQLCGPATAADWNGFPLPILRSLAVDKNIEVEAEVWSRVAHAFVLDHPSGPGGSGLEIDATLGASIAARYPCLVAGGINGENVIERVHAIAPLGTDASSRLESSPGIKDAAKLEAYLANASFALNINRPSTP